MSQYSRIASCIATELSVYGLVEGALAATHIVNIHATSLTGFERGELLDGAAYIQRTARMFQRQDARRFERTTARSAAAAQIETPHYTCSDDMFAWPVTKAEQVAIPAARPFQISTIK
ncbi:hypothetical protein [Sphingomonas aerophila]|uniref:hypothetical protein n=1 Tax=Sphingomonas aerophila TaxID=1344948 RepID=UPI001C85061D|nr:hypothetical protein [Sphingomonas aerophila]